MNNNIRFIGPWRRGLQWACTLLILLLPWLKVDGKSVLRIDIPDLSLYLFGQVLRIEELYLVLLFSLMFILGFLLVSVVLGRVWCGWLCPQTTLSDIAEWTARRLGLSTRLNRLQGPAWKKLLLHGVYLLLGFLVASNLLWYFIPPPLFFLDLVTLNLHYAAWITFILTAMVVYLDLALVRRLMCREICPYGRIQTALVDRATLALHLPDTELNKCIDCGSCVRICPMAIDIRQGYQIECIHCGRCLDACRKALAQRGSPGLIHYTFGLHGEGTRGLLNPRVLLPAVLIVILLVVLSIALVSRPVASLKVAVSHTVESRQLTGDRTGTFFNVWIKNRGQQSSIFSLQARQAETGTLLPLKGQTRATLAAGENRRLDFFLITPANESLTVEFVLTDEEGLELSVAEAYIKSSKRK